MKKTIAIILVLIVAFNLSACRKANNLSDDFSDVYLVETEVITSSTQTKTETSGNISSDATNASYSSKENSSSNKTDEKDSQNTSSNSSSQYTYSTRSDIEFVPPKEEEIIYKKDFFLKHGMNFDHSISQPGVGLAQEKYMKIVKDAGFDHVRLPFNFSESFLYKDESARQQTYERIKKVAKMATDAGLYAIVDVHKFPELNNLRTEENTPDPLDRDSGNKIERTKNNFYKLWSELSDYLKDSDSKVIFEIINEPHGSLSLKMLNEVQNECIRRIRETNPTRWIAAACPEYNTVENIQGLALPKNDKNIFVTFHYYSPMKFTHQNAPWQNPPSYPNSATWGSEDDIKYMRSRVKMMAEWGSKNDRFVHLGEFGVVITAEQKDRVAWTSNMTKLCKEYGVAWSYWDFCFNFGVFDHNNDKWNEELYNALMNP